MKRDSNLTRFHLWIPNMFEFKGGIQVYSAFFLEAIQSLCPNANYDVFLKHDTQSSRQSQFLNQTKFHATGGWHLSLRTIAFAAKILGQGLWRSPDLIISLHLNFTPAAYWLNRLTGKPYWAIAYGVDAWNVTNPGLKKALLHADRILSISHYTRDRLLKEQNLDPQKISVLPVTFDASRWTIAPKPQYLLNRYQLTAEQPIILTVARLDKSERYKGYDTILRALPAIRRHLPNVHYLLVGKGSDRPRIEQLISQLQLEDCVTLTGFVLDEVLVDYYNLCDVFVLPSKSEGFGIVYLEALACGKPTVGGNSDGAVDALIGGELGVLVNPDDEDVIAQTLIQILQKKYAHLLLYQPQLLRQKVIDYFGFEQFKKNLETIFSF